MIRPSTAHLIPSLFIAGLMTMVPHHSAAQGDLPPYSMLRSLQFMQDSVVMGDHSAASMQRFMLETMEERLRAAPSSVFSDPRNTDAALAYAMSGGNPSILDYLLSKDIDGHFDSRVTSLLQRYFSGRGSQVQKPIADLVPEYRNTVLGPYLALIAGNITLASNPGEALAFFDEARLSAPGTIIEEAALRRSIVASLDSADTDKALSRSIKYARRFLHSPYATQFADMFVELVVQHFGRISADNVHEVVALMDPARGQEIYLRIARQATLNGNVELARVGAVEAERMAGLMQETPHEALPELYQGLANVATSDVTNVEKTLSGIADEKLSDRDRGLRDAARAIAEQVTRPAVSTSFTQANSGNMANETRAGEAPSASPGQISDASVGRTGASAVTQDEEPLRNFVEQSRLTLKRIDTLLKQEGDIK